MSAEGYLTFHSAGAASLMQHWDEHELLDRLRDPDSQIIGFIYDRYSTDVFRYVRYRLGDAHLAEDITADVFVRLLEAVRKKGGPQSSVRAWLLSTADHITTDHLRRTYRRPTESMTDDVVDVNSLPGDEFDRREQSRDFQKAYARLTNEQQHVLALRFGEGYSLEETASVMNKKVNAVKALQFRALAALQRSIGEAPNE